ncbi:lipoyl synthase [Nitratifractor salsuginis]|uniref:Lipoyl synthase n=1 Tax=Nitratifractor salsuginis (strain DSM 16511 / JCM 12458 / E9I37-1) TaxID=749222 RepID=E6X3I5_NITSE|nr:lipoyl synthase [Nitratifractor salsuginis]ADV46262.1 lipoic acid synthetase [Nitratifractor salsuginis DSM 16511]
MKPYKPKVKAPDPHLIASTNEILRQNALTTVCEESACPNRTECYHRGTATFMILGDTCTRACRFCNVKTGRGAPPDPSEPERVARAVKELGLKYVVITSVDRDDLDDYGSAQFAAVVRSIRKAAPEAKIELLTPDFRGNREALDRVIAAAPDKLAHNEETVRRLSPLIRPQSDYDRSLTVLRYYADHFVGPVKSSLMVGLGETETELIETMEELYNAGVRQLTIGQYLQPTPKHAPVCRYYPPEYFESLGEAARGIGFEAVASGVLVRSSYYADRL